MNTLPVVELPYEYESSEFKTLLFYSPELDHKSYKELKEWIKEFVGSDCWALTVNREVLFNFYDESTFRKSIEDEWYRNQIIRTPHESILSRFLYDERDYYMRIYMFGEHPWTVNIHYKHKMKCFQMSFSQSQEFYDYEREQELEINRLKRKRELDDELDRIYWKRQEYYQNQ
jgi:hypothetical protein